jgi:DNA-binding NarL/FixJ family response regulator
VSGLRRVAVVEDQAFTREVTAAHLRSHLGPACRVEAYPTVEELLAADPAGCDVVVLDLQLRGADLEGPAAVRAVATHTTVLVFSGLASGEVLEQAQAAGAAGYVSKDTADPAALIAGIETVAAGGVFVDPGLLERVGAAARKVLTPRQQEILRLEALGCKLLQIARACDPPLTEAGVRRHIERIVEIHPDCARQSDRVRLAIQLGLVSPWEVYRPPGSHP